MNDRNTPAPLSCPCGARVARGYGGRLVHMTTPNGKPHYAVLPTPRREGVPLPSRQVAGSARAKATG